MNRTLRIACASLCLLAAGARGQDIHFSQYNASLLNLSPGFTGFFEGDYRFGAIYRSQWQTVPVKYSTFSMNGEAKLQPRQLEKDFVGVGLLFNSDRAGDARYGTTQFYGSASYIHQVRSDSTFIISAGMNMGWCQVGFDFSKMTFDNQYEGGQYNSALPSGEQFSWIRRSFFDLNAGAAMQYINEKRQVLTLGIGVYHVTSPVISYQGNDVSKLDYKFSNYISWQMPIDHASDLVTEALVAFQGKNYELIPYAAWRYHVNREQRQSILAGASFRARDAVILRLGYNQRSMQSGISYDINISRFTPATNRRGGFEIFLNHIIRLKPSFIARKRVCPVSM